MEFGNELARDTCPEKYCAQKNVFIESLPTLIAVVIVAFFSGNLFNSSGMSQVTVIVIELVFVFVMYALMYTMFRGMKKRLAETYISVCDYGVRGICPKNGFANREFALNYGEITKIQAKGDRLFLQTQKGNVVLTLHNAAEISALIQSKMPA